MNIKWLGHSSFLITTNKGKKILTDPFDDTLGYTTYCGNADIITISHNHYDHNYLHEVKGTPILIDSISNHIIGDIRITGIPSYHDDVQGLKRGPNIIFIIEVDGYKLAHLGDLGHILNLDDISKLNNLDVLFIPIGGNYTLDPKEAIKLCKTLNSKIIIPMHYKTAAINLPIKGLEDFILSIKNGEKIHSQTYTLPKKLDFQNKVIILNYLD
ncbi:MAG: MBL fold metallo-hydrolase [Clostridium sp.]